MVKKVILFLLLISVVSCGRQTRPILSAREVQELRENTGLTGSTFTSNRTNQNIPYTDTVASNSLQTVKETLTNEWKTKNIGDESTKLAQAITKKDIDVIKNKDNPTNLTAIFGIGEQIISFNIPIKSGQIPETKRYSETKVLDYTLAGKCTDLTCSEVSLYLSKYTSDKLTAKVGLIFRLLKANFKTELPPELKNVTDNNLKALHDRYKDGVEVEVKDVVFANVGSSTSKVKLEKLDLNINNLETSEEPAEINIEGNSEIEAELEGNTGVQTKENEEAPKAANNTIVFRGKKNERLYGTLNRDGKETIFTSQPTKNTVEISDPELKKITEQYFIKVNSNNPRVLEMTRGFERYRNWSRLDSAIKTLQRKLKETIQIFFNNIKPLIPVYQKISDANNIANTLTLNTTYESGYFMNKNKLIKDIGKDCEVGPYQVMFNTAIPFGKVYPIEGQTSVRGCKNKSDLRINPNDERQYAGSAWAIAAQYFNQISDPFIKDPPLILMAYNQGPNQSYLIRDFKNISFERLIKNNIAGTYYAINYLAIYFINANPEKYGINRNQPGITYSCDDVYSPAQIKSGMCKISD